MSDSTPKPSADTIAAKAPTTPRANAPVKSGVGTQAHEVAAQWDAELSIADIVDFAIAHYRKFIIAGCLGGVLGLVGWYFLASYQAELTLLNNNKTEYTRVESGLELVSWRTIVQTYPI